MNWVLSKQVGSHIHLKSFLVPRPYGQVYHKVPADFLPRMFGSLSNFE